VGGRRLAVRRRLLRLREVRPELAREVLRLVGVLGEAVLPLQPGLRAGALSFVVVLR